MKRFLTYILIGTASLLIFLIALLPASLIWQYFGPKHLSEKVPGAMVSNLSGTIWNGSARMGNPQILSSSLNWHLDDISLLNWQAIYDISLAEEGIELVMQLAMDGNNFTFSDIQGYVEGESITKLTRQFGLHLQGIFYLESVTLVIQNLKPVLVSGSVRWTGGNSEYNAGPIRVSHDFPEMQAKLATDNGLHHLTVTQANKEVLHVGLSPDGWLKINADEDFFLADSTAAGSGSLENKDFIYEEKLW